MEMPALETAIAMIIKFGITATFLIVILYCTELFPTTLRWVFPTDGGNMESLSSFSVPHDSPFYPWLSVHEM